MNPTRLDRSGWTVLVLASIVLLSVGPFVHDAFAMGQAPSTCPNRYDGQITSATISAGGRTYNPLANPGVAFTLPTNEQYTVTFTIQTPAQSSQGNSGPGSTWYSSDTNGYYYGACVANVGPNENVTTTVTAGYSNSLPPAPFQQGVSFYTLESPNGVGFSYAVNWTSPAGNSQAATSAQTATSGGISLANTQSTSGTVTSSDQMTLANFDAGTGGNSLLVVGISANNQGATSVAFNGQELTRAVSSFNNNDAEFWYLKDPSGTGNVAVTFAGQTQAVVGAYLVSNVDQAAPVANTAAAYNSASSSPSISIKAVNANDMVLDLPSIYGGQTLGSPTCTQGWDTNIPSAITGASSSTVVSSAGQVTCGWTAGSGGDLWDDVAVEIRAMG